MHQHTLKTLDAEEGRVGGYLVVWGSPTARDLQGEYFTQETDLALDWYAQRPVLYHHGLDAALKADVIGVIDRLLPDEVGVWAEAQLDQYHRYRAAIQRLIDRGVLGWSSGSLPHLVEVADDGQIKTWPLVEGSLTPTPAEPRRTDVHTIKSAYDALGLDATRLGLEPQNHTEEIITVNEPFYEEDITPATKRLPVGSRDDALKGTRVEVGSPYDTLDAADMLHGYMLLRSAKGFRGVSERYANALAHRVNRQGLTAVKSNELMSSAVAGQGDEWVPNLWSAQIWQRARQDNTVLPLFQAIEMPSNPFELPIEGGDPTVYYVQETTSEDQLTLGDGNAIPDSVIGSGKVTLSAKKLALRVGFSSELVEDAIVPVLNLYREQAMRAITDSIDHVLLNGDTAAANNINDDDGTPATNARFKAFDGLRKLPLVTKSANAADAGNNAPTLARLRTARFSMPMKHAARPTDLAWIVDSSTYAAMLDISEFLTMDKAGALATAMTGQIGFADGIPVFVSAEMPLTEADGKVGGGTNDRGTALCVYRPGWFVGYRRRIAVSVDYLPYYDSYQLTATVRLAFANFDNDVTSALFNLDV